MQLNQINRVQTREREIDVGLRNHFNNVYMLMTLGLLVTALSAAVSSSIPAVQDGLAFVRANMFLGMIIMFSPMLLLSAMFNPMTMRKASVVALGGFFLLFSAYYGILLSTLFMVFTGESLARVFLITSGMFAGMSVYGYTTRADLANMGSMLKMAVWGLFLSMIANWFFQSEMLYYAISAIGVVVYTLMIAYDTQSIKETYNPAYGTSNNGKMAVIGALGLYLNFIMLFQFLLQFMGNRE